jgi:hypothetical protein
MWQAIIKALGLVKDFKNANLCYGKRWWLSKVLWVNAIALVGGILQWEFGMVLPVEAQAGILAILNMLLRFDTDQPLVAKKSDIICNPVTDNTGETVAFTPVISTNPSGMSDEKPRSAI